MVQGFYMSMSHVEVDLKDQMTELAKQARSAALKLAVLPTETKNAILRTLADLIEQHADGLKIANNQDIDYAKGANLSASLIDRLELNDKRIATMVDGVRQVVSLEDPVGEVIESVNHPNGMKIDKVRVPIGVIGIIYESRPNVTVDCAILCLKSGNAAILRGGKEAFHSNAFLNELINRALKAHGQDTAMVQLVPTTDRQAMQHLLKLDEYIHCIIPRGGDGLIRYVAENSTIPVIKHFQGICNLFIDQAADPEMAIKIAINAKVQKPSACNAIENIFIHAEIAKTLLPQLCKALQDEDVELRVDGAAVAILLRASGIKFSPAEEQDLYTEYLDKIVTIKVVNSIKEAVSHVNRYGSAHSDAIVTEDAAAAELFLNGVDSATVYWNVSTRFTDGYAFGLGAEIGISTDRLHARGPMGLKELCTYKYQIIGQGQITD